MKVKTTRFGELEVNPTDIITFNEGLLGFEHLKKYFVVDPGDSTLILWLQSTEEDRVAFPIIEPKIFKPDYIAKLLPADLNGLDLDSTAQSGRPLTRAIPSPISATRPTVRASTDGV